MDENYDDDGNAKEVHGWELDDQGNAIEVSTATKKKRTTLWDRKSKTK